MELSVTDIEKFKMVTSVGPIDWESARQLDQEVHRIIDAGCLNIIFNLDEVTSFCSGGFGVLVYNFNKVKRKGGAVYIISSNSYINEMFKILRFNIIFEGFCFNSYEEFAEKVLESENNKA